MPVENVFVGHKQRTRDSHGRSGTERRKGKVRTAEHGKASERDDVFVGLHVALDKLSSESEILLETLEAVQTLAEGYVRTRLNHVFRVLGMKHDF